jgi:hypothetical protein
VKEGKDVAEPFLSLSRAKMRCSAWTELLSTLALLGEGASEATAVCAKEAAAASLGQNY